jgi:DnaJ-class molecular chaperone
MCSCSSFVFVVDIFCGTENCYDIIGVERTASPEEVRKAYRKLSVSMHPDKSKEANATERFQRLGKAYEVLKGNESRPLFDYYLDHPWVSGRTD